MIVTSTTPGTAVPLGIVMGSTFDIMALSANTGSVFIDVRPDLVVKREGIDTEPLQLNGPVASTGEGLELPPGSVRNFRGPLSQWWMDVATSGDGVSITIHNPRVA